LESLEVSFLNQQICRHGYSLTLPLFRMHDLNDLPLLCSKGPKEDFQEARPRCKYSRLLRLWV